MPKYRPLRHVYVLALACAALVTAGPAAAPAAAAPGPGVSALPSPFPSPSPSPTPPARMSTVGGARLGLPGTQVSPRAGAPALPGGLSARSWIVADAETGEVLAAHNPHWPLPPASTLKMLFADTVLPKFAKDTVHRVTASDLANLGDGSSLVGIKENLTYTVHDLWLGVFLRSGNDAVRVLSAMNGGVDRTVLEMRAKAEELRAYDTDVVSPDGYDMPHQTSSAYDLTLFARAGLQNADFRAYCSTVTARFPGDYQKPGRTTAGKATTGTTQGQAGQAGQAGKTRGSFRIENTNRLLTGTGVPVYQGIAGVKNGYTTGAGNTFTGVAQRGGRTLLVTVMHPESGNDEVYKEAAKLLDWGFAAEGKVAPVGTLVAPLGTKGPASRSAATGGTGGRAASPVTAGNSGSGTGGLPTALGIAAGTLAVVVGIGWFVRRRWPLPSAGGGGKGDSGGTGKSGGTG